MKFFQKYVSLLLVLALCCSFLSVGVLADGEAAAEEIVEDAPAPAIELTVEESSQPEPTAGLEEEPPAVIEIVLPTEAPEATEIPVENVETAAPAETASPVESEAPEVIEIPVEEPVEEEPEASYTVQHVYVNPLYAHVLSEDDIALPELSDASLVSLDGSSATYTTLENAGAYLRGQMVARTESVVISYESTEITTEAEVVTLSESLYEFAIGQTGEADEGDYIRWQVGGWGMSAQMSVVDTTWYITYTYQITYYTTAEQEAAVTTAVQSVLESFAFADDTSDYTKIKTIYDYICSNVSYDYTNLENEEYLLKYTAYAALINKTSVCQGYALLFYRLAQEAGIDSRIIGGYGTQGETPEAHSWNIVALDGSYYYLDATWDAGVVTYSYFLKGSTDFPYHQNGNMNGIDYSSEGFLSAYAIAETSYVMQEEEKTYTEGEYTYTVLAGEVTITSYTGTDVEVIVPATLGGYPVVAIATEAFVDNDTTEKLTFSEGLETIAGRAIVRCSMLQEVDLPSTVILHKDMGNVFGADGDLWIAECPKLENIDVSENNTNIASVDGVLYSKDMTVLMLYPCGNTQEMFVVPDGVERLRDGACRGNPYLKEVRLPDSLTCMGYSTFSNDTALETINIPESCEIIGQEVFRGTDIKSLHIPASVTLIVMGAFAGMNALKEITVAEENATYHAVDGVLYCSDGLNSIVVCYPPQKMDTSYTFPEGYVPTGWAFMNAIYLESVQFSSNITVIPYDAFWGCSGLTHVVIPDTVTSIADGAFGGCNLLTIQIPASVTSIQGVFDVIILGERGSYAERYAEEQGLAFFEIGEEVKGSGTCGDKLYWTYQDGTLTIEGTGEMTSFDYMSVPWRAFRKMINTAVIRDGVVTLSKCAFYGCTNLTTLELPASITEIGTNAFSECRSLTYLDVPDKITEIGYGTFQGCKSLRQINLPDALKSLGTNAFTFCTSLTSITIPGNLTQWDSSVFTDCIGLTSVVIEDGVTYIGSNAFENCTSLTSIEIPKSVSRVEGDAFSNCTSLTSVLYYGSEAEWNSVDIWWGNDNLYPVQFQARPGDVSGNGYVEIQDIVSLVKYIIGDEETMETVNEPALDVTGDGEINILDVVRLMRYLAGYNVELNR